MLWCKKAEVLEKMITNLRVLSKLTVSPNIINVFSFRPTNARLSGNNETISLSSI